MSFTVIVRDENGNRLGMIEVASDQVVALPPRCRVNDYGDVLVVTVELAEKVHEFRADPADEEYHEDARVGSLEDQGFPYAGGYGEGQP